MAKPFENKSSELRANVVSRAVANVLERHHDTQYAIINEWVTEADCSAQFIARRHHIALPMARVVCGLPNIGLHAEGGAA
jgi:hypothetical protein